MVGKKEGNIHPANISLVPRSVQINKTRRRMHQKLHCRVSNDIRPIVCTRYCGGTKNKVIVFD